MTDNTDMEAALNKLMQSTSFQEFYNARYKNLGISPTQTQKIPAILHHIWLTNPANPKDMSSDNVEQIKNTSRSRSISKYYAYEIVAT